MAGFTWKYNLSGGRPLIHTLLTGTAEVYTQGDMLSISSGLTEISATNDTTFLGTFQGAADPSDMTDGSSGVMTTTSTTKIKAIVNSDAVYETADASDRLYAITLDGAGTTGARTVAATSNADFTVVEDKRQSSDPTRLMVTPGEHVFHP